MRFAKSSVLAFGLMGLLAACGGSSKDESTTPAANPCGEVNPCGAANPCAPTDPAAPADGTANPCAPADGTATPPAE